MMEKMHMLKDTLSREIDKLAGKGSMSSSDLEMISKLIWTMKNIYKIEMYEEEGGYSQDGMWRAEGYSERRGRRNSRGNSYGGNSYNDGMSYGSDNQGYSERRRRDTRGRYSMHDAKHEMMEEMKKLMEMEGIEPRDREVLRKAMAELGR